MINHWLVELSKPSYLPVSFQGHRITDCKIQSTVNYSLTFIIIIVINLLNFLIIIKYNIIKP